MKELDLGLDKKITKKNAIDMKKHYPDFFYPGSKGGPGDWDFRDLWYGEFSKTFKPLYTETHTELYASIYYNLKEIYEK